ncbi:hypothetical protein [Xanthomarina gelatinilytica]|uniref:hypothetical protein n=1 Tax=Xanthomarina gelatinilytica TaxID=1137281 RepID=UPI003AA8C24F
MAIAFPDFGIARYAVYEPKIKMGQSNDNINRAHPMVWGSNLYLELMIKAYSGIKPPKQKKRPAPDFQEDLDNVGLTQAEIDKLEAALDKYLEEE